MNPSGTAIVVRSASSVKRCLAPSVKRCLTQLDRVPQLPLWDEGIVG